MNNFPRESQKDSSLYLSYILFLGKPFIVNLTLDPAEINLYCMNMCVPIVTTLRVSESERTFLQLSYQKRNQRENEKMNLFLLVLFVLSKAQVCGKNEEFAECSNWCLESNCNDYMKQTNFCPKGECQAFNQFPSQNQGSDLGCPRVFPKMGRRTNHGYKIFFSDEKSYLKHF